MVDDVILNKAATIERCLQRVVEEHAGNDANLVANQTKQDAIILNLQRACETSIDLAMHVISRRRLGIPQDSRDAFAILRLPEFSPPTWPFGCSTWSAFAISLSMNILVSMWMWFAPSSPSDWTTFDSSPQPLSKPSPRPPEGQRVGHEEDRLGPVQAQKQDQVSG